MIDQTNSNGAMSNGVYTSNGMHEASEIDRQRIWEWNAEVPETFDGCIDVLFEKRVRDYPGAPAVCAWDGELTYSQLDEFSTKLAHDLIRHGLSKGSLVPLCFEKSMWEPVAALGVMKAGGASVALDITQPEGRLRTITDQASSTIIISSISNEDLAHRLTNHESTVLVPEVLQKQPRSNKVPEALPRLDASDVLYVVFTSGSTGTPKGATITHSNFYNAVIYQQEALGFRSNSRVWDFASYAFDVSWGNLLHTLTVGACLCIPSQEQRHSDMAGSITKLRANFVEITPSILRILDPSQVPDVQVVSFIGEAVVPDDVARWQSVPCMINTYGPAECTVHTTVGILKGGSTNVSIGCAVGSNAWIVEPEKGQELVPIGSPGELWIEGPIVGLGYLGDPAKTSAAFVEDPAWLLQGAPGRPGRRGRLYKTGDMVKYKEDGTLDFIGRKDSQVKIHGQRVELSEVDHFVRREMKNGADPQLVAEIITPGGGEPMLVVFISMDGQVSHSAEERRAYIKELTADVNQNLEDKLPSYMIPAAYIPLDGIPVTATGKTDRRSLKELGKAMTLDQLLDLDSARGERLEPSTEMEKRLQALWEETLGLRAGFVGANDSFLGLGGDSLAMIRLVTAARDQGLILTVMDIFEHPQLIDLAKTVKQMTESSMESIEPFSLLQGENRTHEARTTAAKLCSIGATQVEDMLPCTPLQEGLLALTAKTAGDSEQYVGRKVYSIRNDVDIDRFTEAWEEVVSTSSILRTRIVDLPGESNLTQVVVKEKIQWHRGDDIESVIKRDGLIPMGLGTPLACFAIVTSNGARSFVWTMHHALYDGWLMDLLIEQAERAYKQQTARQLTSFNKFVKHINALDDFSVEKYWRSQFNNSETVPYPTARHNGYQPLIDTEVLHDITELKWPHTGVTPTTAIRAAWAILAAGYSNSSAIVFGATLAGRQTALVGVENTAGPTIATVPVQVQVESEQSVHDFLQQLQKQAMEMAEFEQTGLQRIQRISPEIAQTSQFQTLLIVQPPTQTVTSAMFEEGQQGIDREDPTTYGVVLECQLTKGGLNLRLRVDSQLVEQPSRMAKQLEHILRQICDPTKTQTKLIDIEKFSTEDLQEIRDWYNTSQPTMVNRCLHDNITDVAQANPDAPAICSWDGELTYAELEQHSDRLAHHLRKLGVERETMVPFCFEKSAWAIVAMLAVLKAGGAFIPLDPEFPKARRDDILDQCQSTVILSSPKNAPSFISMSTHTVVIVSPETSRDLPVSSPQDLLAVAGPENLAYVLFTSGSTGRPKGVMVEHRGVITSSIAQAKAMEFGPHTRTLQFSSYTFDVSIMEIFITLLHGGCVCVPSDEDRVSRLAAMMNDTKANLMMVTPTVSRLLEPSELPHLRTYCSAGEPMTENDLARWRNSVHLFNGYGPTETSTVCTIQDCSLDQDVGPSTVGRGLESYTWLVDPKDHNRLVAPGAIGELLVQGPLVSRGYFKNEQKTAESYVENPLWMARHLDVTTPARFYKTGDLMRYIRGGLLDYLGRKDDQAKIRGRRVELDEIEHQLRGAVMESALAGQGVSAAVQIIAPQGANDPILVAFFGKGTSGHDKESKEDWSPIPSEIKTSLEENMARRVPFYMIPTSFMDIGSIPVTTAGKTNRRKLRETGASMNLEQLVPTTEVTKQTPTTEMERCLQGLWGNILGVDIARIGADDSFFQNGGDSISAMRLVAAAKKQNVGLTVGNVFKYPKLCQLAEVATQLAGVKEVNIAPYELLREGELSDGTLQEAADLCGVVADSIEDIFPCTPLQQGLLALTTNSPGDYIHHSVLKIREDVNVTDVQMAWALIVSVIPILRTRIIDLPGQGLVQVVVKDPGKCTEHAGEDIYMGLGTPLVNFSSADGSFFLTMHHAVYDGWSMSLLLRQLEKAYQGQEIKAPAPFQGFIKSITNANGERSISYWRNQLDAAAETTVFPAVPSTKTQPQTDQQTTRHIQNLSWLKNDATASSIIRAAWALLFARFTDTTDVVLGAVAMGRQAPNVPDIEDIIGPTIATVPVRIRLEWEQTIESLVQQIQMQATEMAEFEHVGLHRIRRINKDAELATQFQTLLVIQPKMRQEGSDIFKSIEETSDDLGAFGTYAFIPICHIDGDGLQLQIIFDSNIIHNDQVNRIASQFEDIVQILCDPSLSKVTLAQAMSANTKDLQSIWSWNSTVPVPSEHLVHELLAETVKRQSSSPAICAWDGELTYHELDVLADQLAQHLIQDCGVGPGDIVPLYFEKSMWMPVAMLGVMRTGAASVALDVSLPEQRLRTTAELVGARTAIHSATNIATVTGLFVNVKAVAIDNICSINKPQPPSIETRASSAPADPLYIVFTSGSTGVPKGVVITHQNLSSAFLYQTEGLGYREDSRVFDFASYAFDAAWYNALHTLRAGGCLCIPSEHERRNDLSGAIIRMKVNFASMTPKVAEALEKEALGLFKCIELHGEAADAKQVDRWREYTNVRYAYGPAECTILSTVSAENVHRTTIGRGIGTGTWVVDLAGTSLAPVGSVGELWIEGPLVGHGYLNEPEKTAAAFIEDPPWLLKGAVGYQGRKGRLYKTGDLVQYHEDGSLMFVGRRDTQLKIRGQRVELSEIEFNVFNSLQTQNDDGQEKPSTEAQVVVEAVSDKKTLVAFVVPPNGTQMTEEERVVVVKEMTRNMEDRLAAVLPSYMIPAGYIALAEVPMTTTGKTDRKTLRQIGASTSFQNEDTESGTFGDPQNDTELTIRETWAAVLDIPASSISTAERFLRLGGDSVTAMQVVSRCRKNGIQFTVGDMLKLQTIQRISEQHHSKLASKTTQKPNPTEFNKSLPSSPMQNVEPAQFEFWGITAGENTLNKRSISEAVVDPETTSLFLGRCNDVLRCEPVDILAAAVLSAFNAVFFERATPPSLVIEQDGRADGTGLDLSETVDSFTTLLPLNVPKETFNNNKATNLVKILKDMRRRVPGRWLPYSASRYYSEQAIGNHDQFEVLLKYLDVGQQPNDAKPFKGLARGDSSSPDLQVNRPEAQRVSLLEIETMVEKGEMHMRFTFNKDTKHQDRIEEWTNLVTTTIKDICYTLVDQTPSFTLTDLPLLSISYAGLDSLFQERLSLNGIEASEVKDIYPCTPLQEGILISQQRGTTMYANHFIWGCESPMGPPISTTKLEKAWRAVAERHSIFSTIFVDHPETGGMLQVVLSEPKYRIEHSKSGSAEPIDALKSLNPPAFSPKEPQWAVTIYQSESEKVACRIDINHAMNDAVSMSVVADDLVKAYGGQGLTTAPEFRAVVEQIQRTSPAERLGYWTDFLTGAKPCYFPVMSQASQNAIEDTPDEEFTEMPVVSSNVTSRIDGYCREKGITRSEFLQVAWALCLSQYTGAAQVCFGYLASGRNIEIDNVEELVGPVINMLVSYIDVGRSLDDILAKIRQDSIDHFAHQHTSLAEIHRGLGGLSGKRLFNTTITVLSENEAQTAKDAATNELRLQVVDAVGRHEYHISLSASQKGKETNLALNFQNALVSTDTAVEVGRLLESALAYMLDIANDEGSLKSDFFRWSVGSDEDAVNAFWKQEFEGADAVHYPAISDSVYVPQHDTCFAYDCNKILSFNQPTYSLAAVAWAAWSVVITQAVNSSEIIFGVPVETGSGHSDGLKTEISTGVVPIRVVLPEETSVAQILDQMEGKQVQVKQYGRIGLHRIGLTSDLAEKCCELQAVLSVQSIQSNTDQTQGLSTNAIAVKFLPTSSNGVMIRVELDSRVVGADLVDRLIRRLEHVMLQLSDPANSSWKLADLEVLSEDDLNDIWDWNATVPPPENQCVHELFMDMARQQPTSPAVCAWNGELNYGELDQYSTRLAHQLVKLGVGPNSMIPLCFEKSMFMPIAMLAVMKAGGACVALDIGQPEERLRAMAKQVNARLTLCSVVGVEVAIQLTGDKATNIVLDTEYLQNLPYVPENPDGTQRRLPSIDPSSTIYIAFTSGSTGEPKGVSITHSNFATAIRHQRDPLGFTPSSRVYDFASYAFDVAWYNAFQTLTGGGCLCIPSEHQRKNELQASLLELQANHLTVTPTVSELLDDSALTHLRTLELGGEAVRQAQIDRISRHTRVRIAYGPVECTAGVTWTWSSRNVHGSDIGTPLGACVWVVDPIHPTRLVAVGSIGELWIEGPLVGSGYLNNSAKTALSFVEDPPWLLRGWQKRKRPGRHGRLYKTGDLVRQNPDGSLVFVGRKDAQVKLRGQRVELAEVEHHIRAILTENEVTGISIVAEVIHPEGMSGSMLVGFFTANGNPKAEVEDAIRVLETKLGGRVPQYMVPAIYIPLERIPTTATGKTDRRQLRKIGDSMTTQQLADLDPSRNKRQPVTEIEKQLQSLYATVLGIDAATISAEDSFLHMGDSIAVMQLVVAAREQGLAFTVADVFKQPRLCDLQKVVRHVVQDQKSIEAFSLLKPSVDKHDAKTKTAAICRVRRSQIEDIFPCTPLQEGLLALTARRTGDYINYNVLELQSDVDVNRFRAAVEEVVKSSPILRARIVNLPEQGLVQAIIKAPLQWSPGNDVASILMQHKKEPMEIGSPLAFYGIASSTTSPGKYSLVLTLHHALYDGWSIRLLLDRIEEAYMKERSKRNKTGQFQAFVKHVMSLESDSTTEFWQRQLQDCRAPTFPALPSARYQPRIDRKVVHNISNLEWPRSSDITASSIVRAAWALVMAGCTNSTDVLFGATVTGRQVAVPGVENMVGPTIATVPIRTQFEWDQTIGNFLQQVQTQGTDMTDLEQTGLQRIWKIQDCRFQTLLVVQPPVSQEEATKSRVFELGDQEDGEDGSDAAAFGTYALSIECQLQADGLRLQLHYDSNVISNEEQPMRLARQFEHIARQICQPTKGLSELSRLERLSPSDLEDIWKWNEILPEAADECVHEIFTQMAEQQGDVLAVDAWNGQLTYNEIEDLSNRLAHHLISLGVTAESVIPLCFEKSAWTSVTMLAVMKAGATSVALDITQPEDRLWAIIKQVHPLLTVSSTEGAEIMARLTSQEGSHATNVIVNRGELSRLPNKDHSLPKVDPSTALYLAFTSGSTGEPKGVIISHNNVASGIKHQQKPLAFTHHSRVYDFASYAFDVAWYNAFQTLCAGGCLCVPSEHQRKNELSKSILEFRATQVTLTATVLDVLDDEVIKTLDLVETGGEAVSQRHIDRITAFGKRCRIAYGPVECTIGVTWAWEDLRDRDIGRGLGACTWVVDEASQSLVGVGCVGELWIEGPLVGRGYLSDENKTKASFVDDPEWLLKGGAGRAGRKGRLYKTGDLVRYKPDGSLVFVGRKDAQVKLRGQRIELAEVEHHVLEQIKEGGKTEEELETDRTAASPHVVAEVVTSQGSESGMLIVFVAPPGGALISEEACTEAVAKMTRGLDKQLSARVPVYMVPSGYIAVQTIPRITTGKADRRLLRQRVERLSVRELTALIASTTLSPSRPVSTPAEHQLQQIWAEVLRLDPASINSDDSFFRLGGDSIHAMRTAGLARSQGLSLTVAEIFGNPDLSDQAKLLKSEDIQDEAIEPFSLLGPDVDLRTVKSAAASLCGVEDAQVQDVFPCTPLQEGLLAMTARKPGDYVNQTLRELQNDIDPQKFRNAWETVVASTPILRTRVVDLPIHGLVQVVVGEPVQWLRYDDDSALEHQQREHCAMTLGTPLCQVGLFTNSNTGRSTFLWSLHHALYDGWSLPLVLEAVVDAYTGNSQGSQITPFQPFIKHIQASRSGTEADDFWKAQFAGSEAQVFPTLPTAGYQPRADTTLHRLVKDLGRSPPSITTSTVIRTAWATLLSKATSSPDVVFGAVVSGRQAAVRGVEYMVGPTIATVPVRAALRGDSSLEGIFKQVQDNTTRMTQFEQTGLQNIQRLNAECQDACRFQSLLVIQPRQDEDEETAGATVFASTKALDENELSGTSAFSTYAIMLTCEQDGSEIRLSLSIDSQVIEVARAQRMLDQFEHILRQLWKPEHENAHLDSLDMLSPRDKLDIWKWNAVLPETWNYPVHQLFSDTAQKQPDAIAVHAWDGDLTYRNLEELSSRLAYHLLELGIGTMAEPIVPICFEKSVWTSVAMLGVMKAGAATVTLDVTQPEERLRAIVKQANQPITISSAKGATLISRISSGEKNIVVDFEMLSSLPPTSAQAPPLPDVAPESMLYLCFTSGSTGEPKGVMITHANFSSLVRHQGPLFSKDCRALDFASYAFDVAWYNTFQTLIAGGCLCIPSEEQRKNELATSILALDVNQATLTATVIDILPDSVIQKLRLIETGGEAVTQAQIDRLTSLTKVRIAYGPVECTIGVTWATDDIKLGDGAIGYGYGACGWVVDTTASDAKLTSIGSVGELWIEGPLVGRGYLNDPTRTAAAFTEDPAFLTQGGPPGYPGRQGRLYKTGDLVRYNENGSLTFVGRKDTQIKIRGQRVELSEVEYHVSKLLNNDGGDEVHVVAEVVKPKESNAATLVAFIVPANAANSTDEELNTKVTTITNDLKHRITALVPIYMVPNAYLPLRTIPMTTTGKTDRRLLRQQISNFSMKELTALTVPTDTKRNKRTVTTTEERELQELWAAVLGLAIDDIDPNDSFLSVGGDSIQAMRLVSAAQRRGLTLSVADALRNPVLQDMARCVKTPNGSVTASVAEPTRFSLLTEENGIGSTNADDLAHQISSTLPSSYGEIDDVLPITAIQQSFLTGSSEGTPVGIYNFHLDLPSSIDPSRLSKACSRLVQHFEILRTVFVNHSDGIYQVILRNLPVSLEVRDVAHPDDLSETYDALCEEFQGQAPVLGQTLLRLVLLRVSNSTSRFVIRISHAQYDGVAFGRLLSTLSTFYDNPEASLPRESRIANLIAAQRTPVDFTHWNNLLHSSSMSHLPRPSSPIPNDTTIRIVHSIPLPAALRRTDITPATAFTAACAHTLARLTGTTDVLFGRVVAGRAALSPALRDAVFPCLTSLPVRVRVDGTQPASAQVQSQFFAALPYENLSVREFEKGCEAWPASVREFGVDTQWQNVDENSGVEIGGERVYVGHEVGKEVVRKSDTVGIVGVPEGENLRVIVSAKRSVCEEHMVQKVVDVLCEVLEAGNV